MASHFKVSQMGTVNIRDSRTDRPSHLKYNSHISSADPLFIEFQHRFGSKNTRDRSVLVNYKSVIALLALRSDESNGEKMPTGAKLVDHVRWIVRSIADEVARESVTGKARLEDTVASIQNVIDSYEPNETVEAIVALLLPGLLPPLDGGGDRVLESFETDDEDLSESTSTDAAASCDSVLDRIEEDVANEGYFEPSELRDERDRVVREIVQRRGQAKFRGALISAYGGCCAVTDCNAIDALEAAHIAQYVGPKSNDVSNGLLLRADVHTLFDLNLLRVDPDSLKIVLAPRLLHSSFADLNGRQIKEPSAVDSKPSRAALRQRWKTSP